MEKAASRPQMDSPRPFLAPTARRPWRSAVLVLGLAALFVGCRTVPDLRPFTDATSQLSSSIKTAGRTVATEIDSMAAKWPDNQKAEAAKISARFRQHWTQRNALADALLEYSASLAAIAAAGEQGEQSARALAASFQKLCGAIEIAMPPAAAVEGVINIGSHLYGRFSRNYAAKTLGDGMRKLQPSIDETAVLLGHSLDQIASGLDAVRDQIAQNAEDEVLDGIKVGVRRNHARVLSERRVRLLTILADGNAARDALRAELLREFNPNKQQDLARLGSVTADITTELSAVENSLQSELATLASVDARKAADRARLDTELALVQTMQSGLGDWAAAHARLAAAALERQPLQVEDLTQTALEIRDLVKTIRATRRE